MSREAKEALESPYPNEAVDIVRAARILADAIDRLNVALTGSGDDYDKGTLGWSLGAIGAALSEIASVETGYETTRGAIDRIADAIDTFDVKVGGAKVGPKKPAQVSVATTATKPNRNLGGRKRRST